MKECEARYWEGVSWKCNEEGRKKECEKGRWKEKGNK
jgi:hypothetical protein